MSWKAATNKLLLLLLGFPYDIINNITTNHLEYLLQVRLGSL